MMKMFMVIGISLFLASAATAAPIEESVGVDEGKCEVVSVGLWFCKIDGKCYSCGKNKDVDPKRDCLPEERCAAAMIAPDATGLVTRPTRVVARPSDSILDRVQAVTPSVLCQRSE